MELYLAPLQGLTELYFRNAFAAVYGGIDKAMAPFISIVSVKQIHPERLQGLFPEANRLNPVIPQVLGNNKHDFLLLAQAIEALGYTEINWNLGCPAKDIRRKKRGSGLLPYPELIEEVLDYVIPRMKARLSVKLRLGKDSADEIFPVMELLNRYSLSEIIIHPRIAVQFYEGGLWLNKLDEVIPEIRHRFVFNGDVNSVEIYRDITKRYPTAQGVMLGRGLLMNPALAEEIKTGKISPIHEKQARFFHFYDHLLSELLTHYSTQQNMLNKLKEYWIYFQHQFPETPDLFNTLKRLQDVNDFRRVIEELKS